MLKDIHTLSLLDILPDNLLQDEKIRAAAQALDNEVQAVTDATIECLHLPRLNELSEQVLDLLAWQWHVDFYEPLGMDVETKRKLIRESIAWHRRKGTPSAVEEVVSAAFDKTTVKEWYEYGGKPYYFKIVTEDVTTDEATLQRMRRAVNTVKNVRSWLDEIEFLLHLKDHVTVSSLHQLGVEWDTVEHYHWRGRYFDGSCQFLAPIPFDGQQIHNGTLAFDGLPEGAEDEPERPYLYDGTYRFDGIIGYAAGTTSHKLYYNSLEPDPLTILTPQMAIEEPYDVTIVSFDGGKDFDGTCSFGKNGLIDGAQIELNPQFAEKEETRDDAAGIIHEGIQEIYPAIPIRSFDGTWTFGEPAAFDGSYAFNLTRHTFDAMLRDAEPTTAGRFFDGKDSFSGRDTFTVPHPAARYNSDRQEQEHIDESIRIAIASEQITEEEESALIITRGFHSGKLRYDGSWQFRQQVYTA